MKIIQLKNKTSGKLIASKVKVAETSWTRMIGLLNRKAMDAEEGLLITQCNSIHMFFMKFPIDVLFVNKSDKIIAVVHDIKPFRLSRIYLKAHYAVELVSGKAEQLGIAVGDELETLPME